MLYSQHLSFLYSLTQQQWIGFSLYSYHKPKAYGESKPLLYLMLMVLLCEGVYVSV